MKFRKRPIVINALQLRLDNWGEMCEFANVGLLENNNPQRCYIGPNGNPIPDGSTSDEMGLLIPTLEGLMIARQNDWIIIGIRGEIYPCKQGIFEETYEPVDC